MKTEMALALAAGAAALFIGQYRKGSATVPQPAPFQPVNQYVPKYQSATATVPSIRWTQPFIRPDGPADWSRFLDGTTREQLSLY